MKNEKKIQIKVEKKTVRLLPKTRSRVYNVVDDFGNAPVVGGAGEGAKKRALK